MGADGGVIANSRDFMVTLKKNPTRFDKSILDHVHWTTCALSKELLSDGPIVACELGYLYNKSALVQALLAKNLPKKFSHVKSLKDIVEVKFEANKDAVDSCSYAQTDYKPRWVCPISLLEVSGAHRFCIYRTCGHVVSEKAIKEMKSKDSCLVCNTPCSKEQVHILNGNEDDLAALKEALKERRQAQKKAKKDKTSKQSSASANSTEATTAPSTTQDNNADSTKEVTSSKKSGEKTASKQSETPNNRITNKRKVTDTEGNIHVVDKYEIIKRSKQIVKSNADKSDVYKSLFFSEEQKKQLAEKKRNNDFMVRPAFH